ncbi:MAG: nicotinate-nucleotide adenylyltransferase [Luteitalea sp.]|nr:nicotinate-nucleotide adenylyltransferase [Luteitalea sp.]
MTAGRRIGILGGTFDPIHTGHVDLGTAAEQRLGLARVIVLPSHIPPHRPQPLASSFHRFAMVALAVAGRGSWQASDLELRLDGPSYTTDTIRRFHEDGYDAAELFFIIGADAFTEIATWKDYPNILDRTHFAVVSRPGCGVGELPTRAPELAARMRTGPLDEMAPDRPLIFLIDAPTAQVSSTAIRRRSAEGASIAGLVDPRVQQHIEQHGLYTSMNPGRRVDEHVDTPAAGRLHGQS